MLLTARNVLCRALSVALAAAALLVTTAAAEPISAPDTATVSSGEGTKVAVAASHRTHARHRVYVRPRVYHGWTIGWGPYWGPHWGGYWYGPRWDYPPYYSRRGEALGALDTDVSPEKAEIWVDGRRVGVADEFDGFPSYLWLEKGTYDVVIFLPGYKTIARQYSIYPGLVIDVEDRLERGESIHPNDLATKTHERRDERLRRDRERREAVENRSRYRDAAPSADEPRGEWLDARGEPGRLLLRVEPMDASIYLDGRFVGTGDDVARLRAGLLVDSGEHRLEVVRPGFESAARTVLVGAGEESTIDVELAPREGELP